jgi:transposase
MPDRPASSAATQTELDDWMSDAHAFGLVGIRRFVLTLRRDIEAGRNAIIERWSNGQTGGHIDSLKMRKQAVYRQANTELFRESPDSTPFA